MNRRRIVNVAALSLAALVVVAVTIAGIVIGTSPEPTDAERIALLRLTEEEASQMVLTADEREAALLVADVEPTIVRTVLSTAIIPETVDPAECAPVAGAPRSVGGMTVGTTDIDDATASLESSVIVYPTPEDAQAAFKGFIARRSGECASYSFARTDTSLTIDFDTKIDPETRTDEGARMVTGTTTLTFSDGFVQTGEFAYVLVGNAVFYVGSGMNQPLTEVPWGDAVVEDVVGRVDGFIAEALKEQAAA